LLLGIRERVGVDFQALDGALRDCDALIDLIGEHGTAEVACEARSAIGLKEQTEGVLALVAPIRAALRAKK